MEQLLPEIWKWVVGQGPAAVIAGVLAWRLFQREREISAINAARLSDSRELIRVLTENTATLKQAAEAQMRAADGSRELAASVHLLQAEIQRGMR